MAGRSSQRQIPIVDGGSIALENMGPASETSISLEPAARHAVNRPDLRAGCFANFVVSIIVAIIATILGVLVATKQRPVPEFLEGKCANIEVMNFQFNSSSQIYPREHYGFASTASGSWVLLAAVELVLTLVLEAHDRISATALIWFLQAESHEKPVYNTNGRLLWGTRRFSPCHATVNAFATLSTSLCYGAAASMITRIEVEADCSDPSVTNPNFRGSHYGIDISGYALLTFGAALMVQNGRSLWLLINVTWPKREKFHSWSLDPVVNAVHMIQIGPYRTNSPELPEEKRWRSLHAQVPRVRLLVRVIWVMFTVLLVAVGVAAYFAKRAGGFDKATVDGLGGIWQFWGFAYTDFGQGLKTTNWAGPLVQSGMQGLLALSMHCASIVLGFRNDESSWQEAYARYAETRDAFVPRKYRPRKLTALLFITKTVIQWLFSYAVTVNIYIFVSLVPLSVVTVLMLIVAIVLEVVTRHEPGGGAPTTYGEFRLLVNFVKSYHLIWV